MKLKLVGFSIAALFLGLVVNEGFKSNSEELQEKIEAKKKKRKVRKDITALAPVNGDWKAQKDLMIQELANPETGKIPEGIFHKERLFAQNLPKVAASDDLDWIHRGPYNVGGRTRAAAFDLLDEDVILAGGVSGGVWKSIDGGANWQKKTSPTQLPSVTSLVQDLRSGKEHIWYLGSGEGYGNSAGSVGAYYFGNGLYKSEDNGETWNSITSSASNTPTQFDSNFDIIWRVATDPSVDTLDVVYAATYGGISRSTDGGDTWSVVLEGGNAYTTDIIVTNSGVHYAVINSDASSTQRGIWRSENGEDWTNITPSNFPGVYDRLVMDYNRTNENDVYFFGSTPNYGKHTVGFFESDSWNSLWKYSFVENDTAGIPLGTWSDLSDNLPDDGTEFEVLFTQSGYDLTLKVKPDSSNTIFIGGTNLYRSEDGFESGDSITFCGGYNKHSINTDWQIYDVHHPDQHDILFLPSNPDVLISANDGGMFKTTDNTADSIVWESLNNGYYTTQLYGVGINYHEATATMIGGFQDNGNFFTSSADPNEAWTMPYNGDGGFSHITDGEEVFYLSIQNGKVGRFKLDSNGEVLESARIDPEGTDADNVFWMHQYVVDPNNENVMFYPDGKKVWRHTSLNTVVMDGEFQNPLSTGWSLMDGEIESPPTATISATHVTNSNPAHSLYLASGNKLTYRVDSADSENPVWVKLGSKNADGITILGAGNSNCITTNPEDGNEVMLIRTNYERRSIFYSNDGGAIWEDIGGNLEEFDNGDGNGPSVRWASILPFDSGEKIYFVGTSVGLYATDFLNGPLTVWKQIGAESIGNVVIQQILTRKSDGLIVVATHGNGIFTANITSVDEILGLDELSDIESEKAISLMKNPISDLLSFSLSSDIKEPTLARIYDTQGRVRNVFNLEMGQKDHALKVILPVGSYVLVVENKSARLTEKFVVRK